jgi:hypothetical protein
MGDELVRLAVNQDVGAGGKTRCSLRIQVLGAPKPVYLCSLTSVSRKKRRENAGPTGSAATPIGAQAHSTPPN